MNTVKHVLYETDEARWFPSNLLPLIKNKKLLSQSLKLKKPWLWSFPPSSDGTFLWPVRFVFKNFQIVSIYSSYALDDIRISFYKISGNDELQPDGIIHACTKLLSIWLQAEINEYDITLPPSDIDNYQFSCKISEKFSNILKERSKESKQIFKMMGI
jgi:hypothetical protein